MTTSRFNKEVQHDRRWLMRAAELLCKRRGLDPSERHSSGWTHGSRAMKEIQEWSDIAAAIRDSRNEP